MFQALTNLVSFSFVGAAFVGFAWIAASRLESEPGKARDARWLVPWAIKGLGLPLALWILMNIGLSESVHAYMPQVQAVQNSGGAWLPIFFRVLALGVFAVSSNWCAVTLGWIIARTQAGLAGAASADFRSLCLVSFAGMFLPAMLILLVGGWTALGTALVALLAPVAGYAPSILQRKPTPPMYARAVAKIKFGKYPEAEWAIIQELEKCENDFEGWLMLAELYAHQFKDLSEAEQTILEICDQPRTTPSQLSVALHKLADWHLDLAGDPDAARRALQAICHRLPGTHLARMAELRANQLPRTAEEFREQHHTHTVSLPALSDSLDANAVPAAAPRDPAPLVQLAKQLEGRLVRDPGDLKTREKLARALAEQPGKADAAIQHVEALLAAPGQPEQHYAEWLSLIAVWHLRLRSDPAAGRQTLQRIIDEFPKTPQAFHARRRLDQMDSDQKLAQAQHSKPPPVKIKITLDAPAPPQPGLSGPSPD